MARVAVNTNELRGFTRAIRSASKRTGRELNLSFKEAAKIVETRAKEIADNERVAATIKSGAYGGSAYVQVGSPDVPVAALREVGNASSHRRILASAASGTFRHPVFARGDQSRDEWTWVDQPLHPAIGPAAIASEAEMLDKLCEGVNRAFESVGLRMD